MASSQRDLLYSTGGFIQHYGGGDFSNTPLVFRMIQNFFYNSMLAGLHISEI